MREFVQSVGTSQTGLSTALARAVMSLTGRSLACALVVFAVGAAHAAPFTFTVDTDSSNIGGPGGSALSGTVSGTFDAFDRILTLTGGTINSAPYFGSALVPNQTVFTGLGVSVDVSGNTQVTLPALGYQFTGGTVANGGRPTGITGMPDGGSGSVSGNLNVDISGLITTSGEITFSAVTTPSLGFPSGISPGTVGLINTPAGAQLTLPLEIGSTFGNLQVEVTDSLQSLAAILAPLDDLILDQVTNSMLLPGTLVATSPSLLPPAPLPVNYTIDTGRSFLSANGIVTPLTGNVLGELLDGTLNFSGGSSILSSNDVGPIPDFAVDSSAGLTYDIDLQSASLELQFDIGAGRASNGSLPSALDWQLAHGIFSMTGFATLELPLLGGTISITNAPFSLVSTLGISAELADTGGLVGLIGEPGLETLTIPLAFADIDPSIMNTEIAFDAGLFGQLASPFENLITPLVEDLVLAEIRSANYSGLLVATRGLAQGSVPEPATLALLGVALAGLGFSRRYKVH